MTEERFNMEIIFPYTVGSILGYTRSEIDILIEYNVISHLVHKAECGGYYIRSELLAFRDEVRTNSNLSACIEYLLGKGREN